jgi:hypothetical protein
MASIDMKFDGEIFRKDHAIIISSNRQLASILGVRLAYDAAGYAAGTVLARNTTSGSYAKYDNGASSGLDTARCVLLHEMKAEDFASTGDVQAAQALFGGEVFEDKLTGLDSAAKTDLGSKSITLPGSVTILKF